MLFTATHRVQSDHGVLTTHPPPYIPGPYANVAVPPPARVPSLVSLCIRALLPFPDQVHQLPVRLPLRVPGDLDDLVPDPAVIDPRLWANLVQIYDRLPASFGFHTLPLADIHLPLLQSIPSTDLFSLITLLSLPACVHLTDDTVLQLKFLHTLTAFDASNTNLTSYAIKTLAATLQLSSDRNHRGPWQIRVLSLRNCKQMSNDAFPHLLKFPLLSVIDLRGTRCLPNASIPFKPCSTNNLYHPASLSTALSTLYDIQPHIFSSFNPYILNINSLSHRATKPISRTTVAPQDAFVVIPTNHSRVKVGNTHVLEKQIQAKQDALAHENNKAAWYERQERIESRSDSYDFEERKDTHLRRPNVHSSLTSFISSPKGHQPERRSGQANDPTLNNLDRFPRKPSKEPKHHYHTSFPLPPPNSRPTISGPRSTHPDNITRRPYQHTNPNTTAISTPRLTDRSAATTIIPSGPSQSHGLGGPEVSTPPTNLHTRIDSNSERWRGAIPNAGNDTAELQNARSDLTPNPIHVTRPNTLLLSPTTILSTDQFYQARPHAPQPNKRDPSSSLCLRDPRSAPEETTTERAGATAFDAHLCLYRPPPPWSALSDALLHIHTEEARARQQREWNRLNAASAKMAQGEMAVVDMTSEKAARVKRELEKVTEEARARKRQNVVLEEEVGKDEIEDAEEEEGNANGGWDRRSAFKMKTPTSSSSTSSSVLLPIQPLMTGSTSRNPFRRRTTTESSAVVSIPLASASATPTQGPGTTVQRTQPPSEKPRSAISVGVGVGTSKSKSKPMLPISAVNVPVLPPEMHKEALKRERRESLSSAGVKKKKFTSAESQNRRLSGVSKSSGSGGQFDWKNWGKN